MSEKMFSKETSAYIKKIIKDAKKTEVTINEINKPSYSIDINPKDDRYADISFGRYINLDGREDYKFRLSFWRTPAQPDTLTLTKIYVAYNNWDVSFKDTGIFTDERQVKSIAKILPEDIFIEMTERFTHTHGNVLK